jgi:hypothetical protein
MKAKKTSLTIPGEVWARAKHRAIDDGISMGELVVRAIELYLRTPGKKGGAR